MNIESIPVGKIKVLTSVQPRETIDAERVGDFAALLEENPQFEFPPLDVFRDPKTGAIVLADGFTRHQAYEVTRRKLVPCDVHEGDKGAAEWHALFANIRHGAPLNREEHKAVIYRALDHPNRDGMTNAKIAELLGISERTLDRAILDRKHEKAKKTKPKDEAQFSPELLEAIERIGECNIRAKEGILNGSIKKREDELIRFSEFPCETQLRLAPFFLSTDFSLREAINLQQKRPTDPQVRMKEFLHYAMMVGISQEWMFYDDTVSVCITLLRETQPGELVTAGPSNGAHEEENDEEVI
jgi:hypothetical protein